MARWHSCNVLDAGPTLRRLWHFTGGNLNLSREEIRHANEPLPAKLIDKDWQGLYRPKLNVAWVPAEEVFLRVLQLPSSDFAETVSMIELQLEKVSPMPVAQIVWSFDLLPRKEGPLQTVVITIVSRSFVEDLLARLEAQGYLPDRLEVPFIDQLLATQVGGDGVWIYPGAGVDNRSCLAAWWYGGVLRNVNLIHLPQSESADSFLRDQLAQIAWAGELEGWLTSPPRWHLVADANTAAIWEPRLRQKPEDTVQVIEPVALTQVAALTARRAVHANLRTNLLPPEYTAKYKQQFVDRLWMRGLGAILIVYLFGTFIYFAGLEVVKYKQRDLEKRVAGLGASYTNALKLKAQVQVMQDQLNLQFAALNSWKAVAELLPQELQLDGLRFERGKTLAVFGTAPAEAVNKINEFSALMTKAKVDNQPLFQKVATPSIINRGNQATWSFSCELALTDTE